MEVLKGSPEAMIQKETTVFFKSEIALNQLSSMNQRDTLPTHPRLGVHSHRAEEEPFYTTH